MKRFIVLVASLWAFDAVAQDKAADKKAAEEAAAEEAKIIDLPEKEVKEQVDALVARAKSSGKEDFPALAKERKRRSMRQLGTLPHPYTLKVLKKQMTSKKLEGYVKQAAAEAMGDMKFAKDDVRKFLLGRISKEWKNKDALVGIANALGEIGIQSPKDRETSYEYFKHKEDDVYVSMISAYGATKDVQWLPKLYDIFSEYGKKSTAGVNVRVDTGAAGTKDQQAAASRGRGMLKKAKVNRRDGALHACKQAVFMITGQEFEYHDELYDWLKENGAKIGVKEFKTRKK